MFLCHYWGSKSLNLNSYHLRKFFDFVFMMNIDLRYWWEREWKSVGVVAGAVDVGYDQDVSLNPSLNSPANGDAPLCFCYLYYANSKLQKDENGGPWKSLWQESCERKSSFPPFNPIFFKILLAALAHFIIPSTSMVYVPIQHPTECCVWKNLLWYSTYQEVLLFLRVPHQTPAPTGRTRPPHPPLRSNKK
jgi:hypothetical protein